MHLLLLFTLLCFEFGFFLKKLLELLRMNLELFGPRDLKELLKVAEFIVEENLEFSLSKFFS
jgi:hypothetical protein